MNINVTQVINDFKEFKTNFGTIIANSPEIQLSVYAHKFANSLNIKQLPRHTVICFPKIARPATFINAQIIMLFANESDQLIYQYAHELCHIVLGKFPKEFAWFAELLCCTCSNFFTDENNTFRDNVYPLKCNYENYLSIKSILTNNPTAVYEHNLQFKTLINSYCLEYRDIDFPYLLSQFVAAKGNRDVLTLLIDRLFLDIRTALKM